MADSKEMEIEIAPGMIEAGTLAFCAHDCRFEPEEAAGVKIFRSVVSTSPNWGTWVHSADINLLVDVHTRPDELGDRVEDDELDVVGEIVFKCL